jgi:hypothetical protein
MVASLSFSGITYHAAHALPLGRGEFISAAVYHRGYLGTQQLGGVLVMTETICKWHDSHHARFCSFPSGEIFFLFFELLVIGSYQLVASSFIYFYYYVETHISFFVLICTLE